MKLKALDVSPPRLLAPPQQLYRIQPVALRSGARRIGPLKLAPPGVARGRFDLKDSLVGYFAETAETAAYEAIGRRERGAMTVSQLSDRELVVLNVRRELRLLDLAPCAHDWPMLQSLRFRLTQELAAEAAAAGYHGIAYLSAQQHEGQCFALFEPALTALRKRRVEALVQLETGRIHRLVQSLVLRGGLQLMP